MRNVFTMRLVAGLAFTALSAAPVCAANARHPHRNVDRHLDTGGDTGDSQVEKLNQQQLDTLHGRTDSGAETGLGTPLMQQMPAGKATP